MTISGTSAELWMRSAEAPIGGVTSRRAVENSPAGLNPSGTGTAEPKVSGGVTFAEQLKSMVGSVDGMQKQSDVAAAELATGQSRNIHEAMILMEKADIALRSMVAVRNKVMDAYKEIMSMQV